MTIFPGDLEDPNDEFLRATVGGPNEKTVKLLNGLINYANDSNEVVDCSLNDVEFEIEPGMLLREAYEIWKEKSNKK